jgi:hypothetical protein
MRPWPTVWKKKVETFKRLFKIVTVKQQGLRLNGSRDRDDLTRVVYVTWLNTDSC